MHDETLFKSSLRPNTEFASLQFKPGLHNKGLPIHENKHYSFKESPSTDSLVRLKCQSFKFLNN